MEDQPEKFSQKKTYPEKESHEDSSVLHSGSEITGQQIRKVHFIDITHVIKRTCNAD